jgi:phenylpropionate dioxygenase-like ring-hydroxylating dioxygenase large terminal subunit
MAMTNDTRPVSAEVPESMTTVEEYLRADPASPEMMFERSTRDFGTAPLAKECYVSPDWAQLEMEKLWKRVWQMACRENDIPAVGDFVEYTIGNQSVIVVRDETGSIKALQNSCMHRGTALVEGCGTRRELECTFHGWTWNLDGTLKRIPCRWDFPGVKDEACRLPECRVGLWNGFVFINFDPDAPSLEYLGETLPRHFEAWPLARRWKAVHVVKPVPANWKVAFEAFVEDYHVFRTHPQIVPYAGDCNSQYDIFDDLHGRMITAMGVPSPHAGDQYSYQDTVDAMIGDLIADVVREQGVEVPIPRVPEGGTSRQVLAEFMRQSIGQRSGVDLSSRSDTEVLDAIEYHVFPNLIPWGGFSFPLVYRYRPAGRDPNWCLFDIMIFVPFPDGAEMPRDAPPVLLPAEGPFSDAAELGGLGPVYDQDMLNMSRVQKGLQNDRITKVNFARYQEMNIRNFHANLSAWVEQ